MSVRVAVSGTQRGESTRSLPRLPVRLPRNGRLRASAPAHGDTADVAGKLVIDTGAVHLQQYQQQQQQQLVCNLIFFTNFFSYQQQVL